jgi:hypothetical protein
VPVRGNGCGGISVTALMNSVSMVKLPWPVAAVEKKQEDQFFVGTVAVNNVFTAL